MVLGRKKKKLKKELCKNCLEWLSRSQVLHGNKFCCHKCFLDFRKRNGFFCSNPEFRKFSRGSVSRAFNRKNKGLNKRVEQPSAMWS